MHVHIEAQLFRQEIDQDNVFHSFIMNSLQLADVAGNQIRRVILNRNIAALVEEQLAVA